MYVTYRKFRDLNNNLQALFWRKYIHDEISNRTEQISSVSYKIYCCWKKSVDKPLKNFAAPKI